MFWDQDTWMYPPIMMLHPRLGKSMLDARIRQQPAAKQYAAERGYQGAMFPWETAYTGKHKQTSIVCT